MDASPFGKLSSELRNRIYHYFFQAQLAKKVHVDIRNKRARLHQHGREIRSALALTATSRLLRYETLAIFWSSASFRITADALTAYSYPCDAVVDVKPMNRAYHINQDRATTLKRWLRRSGILDFMNVLRSIELDLGVWDPRIYAHNHQPIALRLLEGNTTALTAVLENLTSCSLNSAAECTLEFGLSVCPSTAMGPIRVPNNRKQALVVIDKLCESRQIEVQAKFHEGLLTRHGYSVLFNDVASCRSVADLLVGHIVEEKEEESDDSDGSVGTESSVGK